MLALAIVNLAISAIFFYLITALPACLFGGELYFDREPNVPWTMLGLAHPRFIPGHDVILRR